MSGETRGVIFDVKHYAIHDGPGIRTTVFLKGCPARCLWCANPESQQFTPEIAFLASECIGCGRCMQMCPHRAISMVEGHPFIDRSTCTACGTCVQACPAGALELMGRQVGVQELYDEIASDRPFWERSGGGVTLSGGEPLAQAHFALEFLKKCKERYVHTALESCLHVPVETLEAVAPYVDSFLCDMKIMDDEKHRRYTGVGNELIKKNMAWLLKHSHDVLVRMPLIPGVNDGEENLAALASFVEEHRKGGKVELLPYHRLGEGKYARLGRDYALPVITPPSKEDMAAATRFLERFALNVVRSA